MSYIEKEIESTKSVTAKLDLIATSLKLLILLIGAAFFGAPPVSTPAWLEQPHITAPVEQERYYSTIPVEQEQQGVYDFQVIFGDTCNGDTTYNVENLTINQAPEMPKTV